MADPTVVTGGCDEWCALKFGAEVQHAHMGYALDWSAGSLYDGSTVIDDCTGAKGCLDSRVRSPENIH